MVGAVFAVRHGFGLAGRAPIAALALEVIAGGAVYCGCALLLCRTAAADVLGLLRRSFRVRG
jgi:hypothetical protein